MKKRVEKYRVDHPHHGGHGPKFTNLTEALEYIRHCIQNGNDSMTLERINK